jgi:uncharacterized membrane protein YhaH (DUF805 family)
MSEARRSDFPILPIKPFRDCFSFSGRSTRSELLAFVLFGMVADTARTQFIRPDPFESSSAFAICWAVLWTVPLVALSVRRLHDQGRSTRWMAVYPVAALVWAIAALLPQQVGGGKFMLMAWVAQPAPGLAATVLGFAYLAVVILMMVLALLPGETGGNRYGDDPRELREPKIPSPASSA